MSSGARRRICAATDLRHGGLYDNGTGSGTTAADAETDTVLLAPAALALINTQFRQRGADFMDQVAKILTR